MSFMSTTYSFMSLLLHEYNTTYILATKDFISDFYFKEMGI